TSGFLFNASSRQKLLNPCHNGLLIRCISSIFSPPVRGSNSASVEEGKSVSFHR
ncbi:hypothetical protein L9F63_013429, partial [Diploptera punctata]